MKEIRNNFNSYVLFSTCCQSRTANFCPNPDKGSSYFALPLRGRQSLSFSFPWTSSLIDRYFVVGDSASSLTVASAGRWAINRCCIWSFWRVQPCTSHSCPHHSRPPHHHKNQPSLLSSYHRKDQPSKSLIAIDSPTWQSSCPKSSPTTTVLDRFIFWVITAAKRLSHVNTDHQNSPW